MRILSDGFLAATGRYYARLVLADGSEIDSEAIKSLTVTATINGATDRLTLGAAPAAMLSGTVAAPASSLQNQTVRLYLGRMAGETLEEVPLGVYTITEAAAVDGGVTIKGYDAMYAVMEAGYYPTITGVTTAKAVLRDVAAQAGVAVVLPDVPDAAVSGVSAGYTLREMAGYMAALLGCNACIDGEGRLALRWFTPSGLTAAGDVIYSGGASMATADWTLGKLECSVTTTATTSQTDADGNTTTSSTDNTVTLTAGDSTASGLSLSNPWMTQTVLEGIFERIGGLTYRAGVVSLLGDLRHEPGDLVTVMDWQGASYVLPIMAQTIEYDGGLKMTLSACAAAESAGDAAPGPLTQAMSRYAAELAFVKQLMADNLTATNAKIGKLVATTADISLLFADYATVKQLDAAVADIEAAYITQAQVQNLLADYAAIEELNATNANVGDLETDVANINTLLAGSAGAGALQAIHLTGDNAVIDDAVITDAMIASLSAAKLTAGTICTDLVTVMSQSGNLVLKDNTLQVSDGVRVRVQIGKDAAGDYNLALWDGLGNLLWDASGVYAAGLHDGIIRDIAVAEDAAISGSKLDIASVASRLNADGSLVVDASKVTVDNTTLAAAYKTVTANVTAAQATANAASTAAANARTAADAAQSSIDRLQVGGRNLVKSVYGTSGGNVSVADNTVTLTYAEDKDTYFYIYVYQALSAEKQYVLSFDCSGVLDGDNLAFGITGTAAERISLQNGRCSQVFTPVADVAAGERFIVDDVVRALAGGTHHIVLSHFKVETGAIATDWTPAPEDVDSAITAVTERTTTLETGLSVVQGQIASKVWQTDITAVTDPLGSKVTTLEDGYSAVSQTVQGIQTQVGSLETTADDLGLRMSSAESAIQQQADQIALKVSQTEIDSAIAGIRVGGRNLVLASDAEQSAAKTSDAAKVVGRYYLSDYGAGVLTAGTTVTLSYEVKADKSGYPVRPYVINTSGTAATPAVAQVQTTAEWTRHSVTTALTGGGAYYFQLTANAADGSAGAAFYVRNVKAELGAVATDWSPAPEDMASEIQRAEAKIELKVDKDDNDQIVSMLNASADVIRFTGNRFMVDSDHFHLAADGTITANNGAFTGTIYATGGTIGGWTIGTDSMYFGDETTGAKIYGELRDPLVGDDYYSIYLKTVGLGTSSTIQLFPGTIRMQSLDGAVRVEGANLIVAQMDGSAGSAGNITVSNDAAIGGSAVIDGSLTVGGRDVTTGGGIVRMGTKVLTVTATPSCPVLTSDELNTLFGTSGVTYTADNSALFVSNGAWAAQGKNVVAMFANNAWYMRTSDGSNFAAGSYRVNYMAVTW